MKDCTKEMDKTREEKVRLLQRLEDVKADVKMLQTQKLEKEEKLRNQTRKNEELLGELQELSEAVNALKNDKEFTMTTQLVEQKEQALQEYEHFIGNKQRRAFDRIFSTILKSVNTIREFYRTHQQSLLS